MLVISLPPVREKKQSFICLVLSNYECESSEFESKFESRKNKDSTLQVAYLLSFLRTHSMDIISIISMDIVSVVASFPQQTEN